MKTDAMYKRQANTQLHFHICQHTNLYTVSQKNDNDVAHYNFNAH